MTSLKVGFGLSVVLCAMAVGPAHARQTPPEDGRSALEQDRHRALEIDKAKDALRGARDLARSEPAKALAILRAVSRGLKDLKPDPTLWLVVAYGFAEVGALTYADLALWHGGEAIKKRSKDLRAHIERQRRFLGIPAGKKWVEPELESPYGRDLEAAYASLYNPDVKAADLTRQLKKLSDTYGKDAPGVHYLACALAFRDGELTGRTHCEAAIKAAPEFWRPMSLLAWAAKATRKMADAKALYRKVIALAPHQREAYLELMNLLKDEPEAMKDLQTLYDKRFPSAD